jgi:hypothetical protein
MTTYVSIGGRTVAWYPGKHIRRLLGSPLEFPQIEEARRKIEMTNRREWEIIKQAITDALVALDACTYGNIVDSLMAPPMPEERALDEANKIMNSEGGFRDHTKYIMRDILGLEFISKPSERFYELKKKTRV